MEQILIREEDYPIALIHVDGFWKGKDGDNTIYDILTKGVSISVEVTFEVLE